MFEGFLLPGRRSKDPQVDIVEFSTFRVAKAACKIWASSASSYLISNGAASTRDPAFFKVDVANQQGQFCGHLHVS